MASRSGTRFGTSPGHLVRYAGAALLVTTASLHIHVAPNYSHMPDDVKISQLFYLQATLSLLTAAALVLWDRAEPWWTGASICIASLVAVLESVYVQEKHAGFFPQLYEPTWYAEKTATALAEVAFLVLWLGLTAVRLRATLRARSVGGTTVEPLPAV